MTEGLQKISLQNKNEVASSSAETSTSAEPKEGETLVFGATNPVSAKAGSPAVSAFSADAKAPKDNSVSAFSDTPVAAKSDDASAFSSAATTSAKADTPSIFGQSSKTTSDVTVFSMAPKEKTYTADEYQIETIKDETFGIIGSKYSEAIDDAFGIDKKSDVAVDDTPVVQIRKNGEARLTKNEWKKIDKDIDDNFKKFIKNEFAKYGTPIRDLEYGKKIKSIKLVGDLKAKQKGVTDPKEIEALQAQFQNRLKEVMSADEAAKNITQNPDNAEGETKYYAAVIDATAYAGIEQIEGKDEKETQKLREDCVKQHVENIPKRQMELSKAVAEAIPEDYSKEDAEKVLKAASHYTDHSLDNMTVHVAEKNYSKEFNEQIAKIAKTIEKQNREYHEKFIQQFWESAKGQIILKHVKYVAHELHEAKVEYEETQAEVELRTEEAEEARKESEKAKEEVKIAKKQAAAILADYGIKDLSNSARHKAYKKFIKSVSPKAYMNLVYAKEQEKKAYWAEWDANAAQEHAELLNKFAEQKIAFANARLYALTRALS